MEFVRKAIALSHTFIILIVVAIAFTCHNEWQEVEALEVGNRHIDEFRKEVNRIHIQLIEVFAIRRNCIGLGRNGFGELPCPTHCIGQHIVPVQ